MRWKAFRLQMSDFVRK
jgi:hypothetical protein